MIDFEKECQRDVESIAEELERIGESGDLGTMGEYLEDNYDIEYRVDREGRYKSVKIAVAIGGPNIYVDTKDAYVRLYWGFTEASAPFPYKAAQMIDELYEEQWEGLR